MRRVSTASRKQPEQTTEWPSLDPGEIARVAYQIWEERGRMHGQHENDWYEAERRIRARQPILKSQGATRRRTVSP